MKRFLSLLLAAILLLSLASCSSDEGSSGADATPQEATAEASQAPTEPATHRNAYHLSQKVAPETVVDGVMTDISGKDAVLQRTTASWADACVMYEVNERQFTEEGTFRALEGHLDRLRAMGINTLWLMPIHPISVAERKGTLGSYYAVQDYTDVNPEFGTKDDFVHFIDKAHEMGFKVMLDWVANHTGRDHKWLTEHPDWYVRDKNGEVESPYNWTDTAKLNYDNYEMRAEMIRCMQYWVEEMGVDGFRCDHAIGVPATFWNAAVYKLKSVNSEILMLAETSAAPGLIAYAFDSCYNDSLYGQICMVRGGVDNAGIRRTMDAATYYPEGTFPMNYLDNHDKNSYEGTIVTHCGAAYPALVALTFTAPGYPMIYTSNEEGYDHEIEFFEKDTVVWDDEPKYAPVITALSELKTQNKALASSNQDLAFLDADNPNVLAYTRTAEDSTVIYVSNLFYEDVSGVTVDLGYDSAACVLHWDGTTLDTQVKTMTKQDFENKDFNTYEFYILTVDSAQ